MDSGRAVLAALVVVRDDMALDEQAEEAETESTKSNSIKSRFDGVRCRWQGEDVTADITGASGEAYEGMI